MWITMMKVDHSLAFRMELQSECFDILEFAQHWQSTFLVRLHIWNVQSAKLSNMNNFLLQLLLSDVEKPSFVKENNESLVNKPVNYLWIKNYSSRELEITDNKMIC
jgi:hypothetical protein